MSKHRDLSAQGSVLKKPSFKERVAAATPVASVKEGDVIQKIPLDQITFYRRETFLGDGENIVVFNDYDESRLNNLADDIETNGLIDPITVFVNEEGLYECLAGKQRTKACRIVSNRHPENANLKFIDAVVHSFDKVAADDFSFGDLIYVNSNMYRRQSLTYSELGRVYEMTFRATSRQGVKGSNPNKEIAEKMNDTVSRVRQLRNIIPEKIVPQFLNMIDDGKIALSAASKELCHIDKENQRRIYQWSIKRNNGNEHETKRELQRLLKRQKISLLRIKTDEGRYLLSDEDISKILTENPENSPKVPSIGFLKEIIPAENWDDTEGFLRVAVEAYKKNNCV